MPTARIIAITVQDRAYLAEFLFPDSFRPFARAVLQEHVGQWFNNPQP